MKYQRKKIAWVTFTQIQELKPNSFYARYKWHTIAIQRELDDDWVEPVFYIQVKSPSWIYSYDWYSKATNMEKAIRDALEWSWIIKPVTPVTNMMLLV